MTRPDLEQDYTLAEVAAAIRMSPRWIRDRIRLDGAEHQRCGNHIRFTAEQVAALRAMHARAHVVEPVTTGPVKVWTGPTAPRAVRPH